MTALPASAVRYLCVHYSATPIERPTSYAQIELGHLRRGFREFGYHRWFPRSGGCFPGRDIHPDGSFEMGAHSQGENGIAIGLCYEGGVRAARPDVGFDSRTLEQSRALIAEIDRLLAIYGGDGCVPGRGPVVCGHRDMPGAATQCPGFDVSAWWREVQAERAARARIVTSPTRPDLVAAFSAILRGLRDAFAGLRSNREVLV